LIIGFILFFLIVLFFTFSVSLLDPQRKIGDVFVYLLLFLLSLYGFDIPLSRNSRMVGRIMVGQAPHYDSETVNKPYIITFQFVCREEIMVGQPFDCAQGRSHPTAIAGIAGTKTVLEQSRARAHLVYSSYNAATGSCISSKLISTYFENSGMLKLSEYC